MTATPDFYQVLGVSRGASQDEIQRAYRKLAREYHPDINKDPGAEERFKEISEAYDILSDPETRRRYDHFGPDFRQIPEGVDPEAYARARAGGGRARGARTRRAGPEGGWAGPEGGWAGPGGGWAGPGGAGVDLEDLLEGLFGGRARRPGRGWGRVPGADQEAEIEVSVEEAYRGGRRALSLAGPAGTRTLEVTIPPGVTEGQRIRVAGQGGSGSDGAPPGDLFLTVRIPSHPRYRVKGRDVSLNLPLTPWEAALGTSVAVETPGGTATVKVPPGTSSGRRLRLRGRGLPNRRGTPGDLYAEVRIVVPPSLSDDERQLLQQLADRSTFDPRSQR